MISMITVFEDIQEEIEFFFNDLNWTFILIYVFVLYGIKHKEEFKWYNDLFNRNLKIKSFKVWIAGLIIAILFSFFKYLESGMTPTYVSEILRSWIIVIVFNSVFSEKINKIESKDKNKNDK